MRMNAFEQAESVGRRRFIKEVLPYIDKQYNVIKVEFTQGKYDRYDVLIRTTKCLLIVELKVRNIDHDKYGSVMLEWDKSLSLKRIAKEMGTDWMEARRLYVNMYSDKVTRVMELDKLTLDDVNVTVVSAPRHTATDSGRRLKRIIEIPNRLTTIIRNDD